MSKNLKLIAVFLILSFSAIFFVQHASAEACSNRSLLGNTDIFWGDPPPIDWRQASPRDYADVTAVIGQSVRLSIEGEIPGVDIFTGAPDCTGVAVEFEIYFAGSNNPIRTISGTLNPGGNIVPGNLATYQWYIDWTNDLNDGVYRLRLVRLRGSAVTSYLSPNTLTIVNSGSPPPPPPPPPTATIDCNGTNPCSITFGASATINWNSSNATSCTVSPGGWTGVSGSQNTGPLSTATTYTVDCVGASGSTQSSVTVNVASAPPPTCTANFSPATISTGQQTTLTWSSGNDADGILEYACTGSIGSGITNASGSSSLSPSDGQTCTFTAINGSGSSVTCSASLTVNPPPPPPPPPPAPTATTNCNGTNPCSIAYNTSATINWSSTNATSCTVFPNGWIGTSGTRTTGNLATTTTYSVNCTGGGGSVSASVDVSVGAAPPPPAPPPPQPQSSVFTLFIPNPFAGDVDTTQDLFDAIITFLYYIAAPIVVIMIILAGVMFLIARDDSNKVNTAKRILLYALIGLAIILIGRGFIALIESILALGGP